MQCSASVRNAFVEFKCIAECARKITKMYTYIQMDNDTGHTFQLDIEINCSHYSCLSLASGGGFKAQSVEKNTVK